MSRTWWHVHEVSSRRCHGGATDRGDAVGLMEVNAKEYGLEVALVESLDSPDDCAYRVPGWVSLHGRVPA